MNQPLPTPPARRSFLLRMNGGIASLAAMAAGSAALLPGKTAKPAPWEPARHPQDDWFDKPETKHRLIFDTTTANGFAEALAFAANYINVNKGEYKLEEKDLSLIVVARHKSTPFGYNDAIWAKYSAGIAKLAGFDDPKTKMPARVNVFNATDYNDLLPNRGVNIDSLVKKGVQFGICSVATRGIAGVIAQTVGGKADEINAELIANIVPNARMVPAGIVAVSRAQERGYTLVSA